MRETAGSRAVSLVEISPFSTASAMRVRSRIGGAGASLRLPQGARLYLLGNVRLHKVKCFAYRLIPSIASVTNSFILNGLSFLGCWHGNCHIRYQLNIKAPWRQAPMTNPTPATVDERRAAVLLGLTPPELRWFSRLLGLGHKEENGAPARIFFTYDELRRLSSAAAASAK